MYYGNVEDFKSYHTSRGREIPVGWTDSDIEAALLVSSEWLDGEYSSSFIGWKTGDFTQEMEWPRTNAVVNKYPYYIIPNDEIPEQVVKSTYEACFRQLTDGNLQVDFTPSNYRSVSVDDAISVEYRSQSASAVQVQIPVIDALLQDLLGPGGNSISGSAIRG